VELRSIECHDLAVTPPPVFVCPGVSVIDLVEASGRLHELGHLSMAGASEDQIAFWAQSCLAGRYGNVLKPLFPWIDTDLIHAALNIALRTPFFPFLPIDRHCPGTCGHFDLRHVHPVLRFYDMVAMMLRHRLGRARDHGLSRRSDIARFHDDVIDHLQSHWPTATAAAFDHAGDNYGSGLEAMLVGASDELPARLRQERRARSVARAERLAFEMAEPQNRVSEPSVLPPRVIYLDAEETNETLVPRRTADTWPHSATEWLAVCQAVADATVWDDWRLLYNLAEIEVEDRRETWLDQLFDAFHVPLRRRQPQVAIIDAAGPRWFHPQTDEEMGPVAP
jgi:hypothetical protein